MSKFVPPQLGSNSFSCPHCGTLAHQSWFEFLLDSFKNNRSPHVIRHSDAIKYIRPKKEDENDDEEKQQNIKA
jgi:hypothetical protein